MRCGKTLSGEVIKDKVRGRELMGGELRYGESR